MISRHQGKLMKGFFTRNVSVHPEIKTCNKNCKNCPFKRDIKRHNIISPIQKTNTSSKYKIKQ